jgi:ribonucleoside-diphosphate reductase alpha chain
MVLTLVQKSSYEINSSVTLTEVVVRANDTKESLKNKIRLATILGTLQSNLTKFQFLSAEWVKNTKEERLLGVSLTGNHGR